jgi:hypothetical protein
LDKVTKDFKSSNKEIETSHQIAILRQGKKTAEETIMEFRLLTSVSKSGCSNRKKLIVQPNCNRFFCNCRFRFWLNRIGASSGFLYLEKKKNSKRLTATGCSQSFSSILLYCLIHILLVIYIYFTKSQDIPKSSATCCLPIIMIAVVVHCCIIYFVSKKAYN